MSVTSVTSNIHREFQTSAANLQRLAEVLLRDASGDPLSPLPALEPAPLPWWKPVDKEWMTLFKRASPQRQEEIRRIYGGILQELWESQACQRGAEQDFFCGKAYLAIERWLRRTTLTTGAYRPDLTLKPVWLLLAIHNWLWWATSWLWLLPKAEYWVWSPPEGERRKADEPPVVSESRQGSAPPPPSPRVPIVPATVFSENGLKWLETQLARDVDPFLEVLLRSDDVTPGDLVVAHLMTVNLNRYVQSAAPANVHISVTAQEAVGRASYELKGDVPPMPKPLADRLSRIQRMGPIVFLSAWGEPDQAWLQQDIGSDWRWMDRLLLAPGMAGLRQSLASNLGEHLVAGPEKDTPPMLRLLSNFHSALGAPAARPKQGTTTKDACKLFVAQTLWACLPPSFREPPPGIWLRWSAGHPEQVSLAQWCGRVARWAEMQVREGVPDAPPPLASLWIDLARGTLNPWLEGQGAALLCLGLWIQGYLEGAEPPPSLTLGRRVSGHGLEELVELWLRSLKRQERRTQEESIHGNAISAAQ